MYIIANDVRLYIIAVIINAKSDNATGNVQLDALLTVFLSAFQHVSLFLSLTVF